MSEELCEYPNCRGIVALDSSRSEPSIGRTRVCIDCLNRLADTLRELSVLYTRCGTLLQGERTRGTYRVRGGERGGIVLQDALVEARTEILSLSASWAALVVDEAHPPVRPRRKVAALVDFLLGYRNWLGAHPAIADAIDEFADVLAMARRTIDPPAPDAVELGSCGHPGCDRMLYAHTDSSGTGPGARSVRCQAGHSWRPHQWLLLDRRLARQHDNGHGEPAA